MRLAIVSDAWLPQINGVVRTLEATCATLREMGHEVEVFGPHLFQSWPCPAYPDIRLALWPSKRLGQMLQEYKPDALHIATEGPLGWAARAWCLRYSCVFTTAYHTRFPQYLARYIGLPVSLSYRVLRWFHKPAKATLVPTCSVYDELSAQGFRHLAMWSRGVDLSLFQLGPYDAFQDLPRPIFLYVGRVSKEKNLDAFLSLPLKGSKVVIGPGPELELLKAHYPETHFLGGLEGETLAAHFRSADIFVFPSLTDTFGLVLIEALASGLKVAAYPVTGPRDIFTADDLRAGVACLDESLEKAVQGALVSPATPEDCRAVALRFSWEKATAQFLAPLL